MNGYDRVEKARDPERREGKGHREKREMHTEEHLSGANPCLLSAPALVMVGVYQDSWQSGGFDSGRQWSAERERAQDGLREREREV